MVTFENESQGTSYLFTDTNKRLKFHTSDPGEDDSLGNTVLYNNFPDTATFAGNVSISEDLNVNSVAQHHEAKYTAAKYYASFDRTSSSDQYSSSRPSTSHYYHSPYYYYCYHRCNRQNFENIQ